MASEHEGVTLDVRLLGGFQVSVDGIKVPDEAWSRRNAATILKILALAPGHRQHREQIMDHLWPDTDPRQAVNNLHQTMHAARRALDSAVPGSGQILVLQDQVIQFAQDTGVWVDAIAFEQAATSVSADLEALPSTVSLYAGPLLPDDSYESWTIDRRESLSRQYLEVLERLARVQEERADADGALDSLRRIVAIDPLHEPAHRALMRIYARTGQRQQAIRAFQMLEEALRHELDLEPEPETLELQRQILAGDLTPDPTDVPSSTPVPARNMDNLPAAVNTFIGRGREKEEVRQLLCATRLLTLTGPGGCGKSRLSLEIARSEIDRHADGVWLVELASLSDPVLIPQAIAGALGVREMPGYPVLDTLNAWFRSRDVLLVLDNCEHLIDSCANLAATLLRSGPGLTILATSREPLRIDGETTWIVPSLSLPDPSDHREVDVLLEYESVQLFIDRARQALPEFRLAHGNAHAVAELCYRLDGIPLAIELAASRMRALTVEQIVDRLGDRFALLTSGSRTALSRQQTLRATLDWSYNLLDEHERVLFERLSVFSGGFDLPAVEEVCSATPLQREEVFDLLTFLVDRSLVVTLNVQGERRYTLLETMREYARDRLEERGDTTKTKAAHARYFSTFAGRMAGQLRSADQGKWLLRLEREHDNLRMALGWYEAANSDTDLDEALLLAGTLYWFWYVRGHFSESIARLGRLLTIQPTAQSRGRGTALTAAGVLSLAVGEYTQSRTYLNDAIALHQALGDPAGQMPAMIWAGWIERFHAHQDVALERLTGGLELATRIGDSWHIAMANLGLGYNSVEIDAYDLAEGYLARALELFRTVDDYWGKTTVLQQMATLAYRQEEFPQARRRAMEILSLEQSMGDKWLEMHAHGLLGEVARAEGDYETAASAADICLAMAQEMGNLSTIGWTYRDMGFISLATGEVDAAESMFLESLSLFESRSYPLGMVCTVAGLAGVALTHGEAEVAAGLLGTVENSLVAIQISLAPADLREVEKISAGARDVLGDVSFEAAFRDGAGRSLDEGVRFVKSHFGFRTMRL